MREKSWKIFGRFSFDKNFPRIDAKMMNYENLASVSSFEMTGLQFSGISRSTGTWFCLFSSQLCHFSKIFLHFDCLNLISLFNGHL